MAVRIQAFRKDDFDQSQFSNSFSPWWNSYAEEELQSKATIPNEATYLDLKQVELDSFSTQSKEYSHESARRFTSQDRSFQHDPGIHDSTHPPVSSLQLLAFYTKPDRVGKLLPVYIWSNRETYHHPSQPNSFGPNTFPRFPVEDAYFNRQLAAYGVKPVIQPQIVPNIMAMKGARIPLPLSDEGSVLVNAKQYLGILRRRRSRAKLEAQNKLLKSRKPYLHESRHRHAVNRVRGSGGRFLSTKNQKADRSPDNVPYSDYRADDRAFFVSSMQ